MYRGGNDSALLSAHACLTLRRASSVPSMRGLMKKHSAMRAAAAAQGVNAVQSVSGASMVSTASAMLPSCGAAKAAWAEARVGSSEVDSAATKVGACKGLGGRGRKLRVCDEGKLWWR